MYIFAAGLQMNIGSLVFHVCATTMLLRTSQPLCTETNFHRKYLKKENITCLAKTVLKATMEEGDSDDRHFMDVVALLKIKGLSRISNSSATLGWLQVALLLPLEDNQSSIHFIVVIFYLRRDFSNEFLLGNFI